MKYHEFERVISSHRLKRYLAACNGNTAQAMSMYRNNLRLAQEMFAIISYFEVALRNAIDREMTAYWGNDWLRDLILPGGAFHSEPKAAKSCRNITRAYNTLVKDGVYSHSKLLAEIEFGTWKYMFAKVEYRLTGRILLRVFPLKPKSTPSLNFGNSYIFDDLDKINRLRNRIAHHEPICFNSFNQFDTFYILDNYCRIIKLFQWMKIDSQSLLYGVDHIKTFCAKLDKKKNKS